MARQIQAPRLRPDETGRQPVGGVDDAERRKADWKRKCGEAALFVATFAIDADDCHRLLDMLGLLDPEELTWTDPVSPDFGPRSGRT